MNATTTVPSHEVMDYLAREQARRGCTRKDLYELIASTLGQTHDTVERRINRGHHESGRHHVDLADAVMVALDGTPDDIPSLVADVEAVAGEAWCPQCRERVMVVAGGTCTWCDTPTTPDTPPAKRSHAGVPYLMGQDVLEDAARLYATGMSMRKVAARLHHRTAYRTANSFTVALFDQFRRRDWPVRAPRRVVDKGLSRRRRNVRRRQLRAERGHDCEATTTAGKPCRNRAIEGEAFCSSHHPDHAAHLAEVLSIARERWAADWEQCGGVVENKARKGQRCRQRATPGTGFCHLHQHQAQVAA